MRSENEIGTFVIETAIAIHRHLGPGLLESVYETVLAYELGKQGLTVERQVPIAIKYKEIAFEDAFRADLIIERKVIIELKSVEEITKVHRKQLQTYLHLTGMKLGYILNFGAALMRDGIVRSVNGLEQNFTSRTPPKQP